MRKLLESIKAVDENPNSFQPKEIDKMSDEKLLRWLPKFQRSRDYHKDKEFSLFMTLKKDMPDVFREIMDEKRIRHMLEREKNTELVKKIETELENRGIDT